MSGRGRYGGFPRPSGMSSKYELRDLNIFDTGVNLLQHSYPSEVDTSVNVGNTVNVLDTGTNKVACPPDEKTSKIFTWEEVEKHNTENDCWIVITNDDGVDEVLDVTRFLDDHPGGGDILLDNAGRDATDMFESIGHSQDARITAKNYKVFTCYM
jgi:cytochrome b involved in lipid metabolism